MGLGERRRRRSVNVRLLSRYLLPVSGLGDGFLTLTVKDGPKGVEIGSVHRRAILRRAPVVRLSEAIAASAGMPLNLLIIGPLALNHPPSLEVWAQRLETHHPSWQSRIVEGNDACSCTHTWPSSRDGVNRQNSMSTCTWFQFRI